MNRALVSHLRSIAEYYTVSADPIRTKTFRNAAANIELVNFKIDRSTHARVDFKGIGKSVKEVIKEFIETGKSQRLDDLLTKYPPIDALKLLDLPDFDLELIQKLWTDYGIYKKSQLHQAKDLPQLAKYLDKTKEVTQHQLKTSHNYPLLGDCAVHTAYGTGTKTVEDVARDLVEMNDKHLFFADYYESPCVLHGINMSRFQSQKESIKEAQMLHGVRIFHGAIVDIDLQGQILADKNLFNAIEFVVLKLSTQPHTEIFKRLTIAIKTLQAQGFDNIIVDCLDKYSSNLNIESFNQFAEQDIVIHINTQDAKHTNQIIDLLKRVKPLKKVALGSWATNRDEFDQLEEAAILVETLGYKKGQLINCLPHPFNEIKQVKNTIGVRRSPSKKELTIESSLSDSLEKIEIMKNTYDRLKKEKK